MKGVSSKRVVNILQLGYLHWLLDFYSNHFQDKINLPTKGICPSCIKCLSNS